MVGVKPGGSIERAVAWGRRLWARAGDGLVALALFAAGLMFYLQTLAPSVATLFDDSLEFPLAVHRLAILHPTGYPLYALLGRLFTLLPGGNVAWAVNLLSAVAGALAVALLYLAARPWTRRRWPAALGAAALAVSPVFWSQAVVAEVYTLNALFVAALLWLVTCWARRPLAPVVPFSRFLVEPGDRPAPPGRSPELVGAEAATGGPAGLAREHPEPVEPGTATRGLSRFLPWRVPPLRRRETSSAQHERRAHPVIARERRLRPKQSPPAQREIALLPAVARNDSSRGSAPFRFFRGRRDRGAQTARAHNDGIGGEQAPHDDSALDSERRCLPRDTGDAPGPQPAAPSSGDPAPVAPAATGDLSGQVDEYAAHDLDGSQASEPDAPPDPGPPRSGPRRLWATLQALAGRLRGGLDRAKPGLVRVGRGARSGLRRAVGGLRRAAAWTACQVRRAYRWLAPIVQRLARGLYRLYRHFFPAIPARRRLKPGPWLYAVAACFGLALAHHRTILLLAPALLVFLLLVERRVLTRAALLGPQLPDRPGWLQIAGRPAVLLALYLLVPLLLYLYLPLRGYIGSLDGTYDHTWAGFWRWVTASSYGAFFGENALARDLDAAFYAGLFWRQFGPVGLALALVGLVGLASHARAGGWRGLALTTLAFAASLAFAVLYRVPDVEVFLIPALLVTAIWIGVGLDHALDRLRVRGPSLAWRRVLAVSGWLLAAAALAQPLSIAARAYPDLDLSRRWIVHDYADYLLEQPLPPESTVVGLLGEMTLLRTFQETTGLGATLETVVADDETARRQAVEEALGRGRAVYITRSLPGLTGDHSLDAVIGTIDVLGQLETLARVTEPDSAIPDLPRPVDLEPVPGLQLVGYGVLEHRGHWQAWARLRLWWRAPQGLDRPLKISARLMDVSGRLAGAADAEPVSSTYPTTGWRPGEVVVDAYEIPLSAGLPPDDYLPMVVVYEPATGAELGRVELAPVYLQGNPARPPRRALEASVGRTRYARLGELELLGFTPPDPDATYRAGDGLPLTLLWQARGELAGNWELAFWLEGREEVALGQVPVGGDYGTAQWADGQVVRQWPVLPVRPDVPVGTYRLKMRVTRDGRPLPWGRWLLPLGSDLDLGSVQVGD